MPILYLFLVMYSSVVSTILNYYFQAVPSEEMSEIGITASNNELNFDIFTHCIRWNNEIDQAIDIIRCIAYFNVNDTLPSNVILNIA